MLERKRGNTAATIEQKIYLRIANTSVVVMYKGILQTRTSRQISCSNLKKDIEKMEQLLH